MMNKASSRTSDEKGQKQAAGRAATTPARRGRPAKEPPPPKLWRVVGLSPEGLEVTLGRYVSREEAEPELERMREDGFYEKLHVTGGAAAKQAAVG